MPPKRPHAYNSGFTQRSSLCSSLGLRQPARRSLRLLKTEAQASCPSRRFVNPRAVIRNGRFGEKCLKDRAAESKPETTWSSPLKMEEILKIIRSKTIHPRWTSIQESSPQGAGGCKPDSSLPDATPKAVFLLYPRIADIRKSAPDSSNSS